MSARRDDLETGAADGGGPERAQMRQSRALAGLIVCAAGLLLTAHNLGFVRLRTHLHLWPVVLVMIGLARVVDPVVRRQPGPYLWMLGGAMLLAHNLDFVDATRLWPLLLVFGGASLVWRARPSVPQWLPQDEADYLGVLAFMSGVERRPRTQALRGGDLTAIMGGCDIDLREARLSGSPVVLDVFVLMGGIDVKVPPGCQVSTEVLTLLGGIEDRTHGPADARSRLVLRGTVLLGGVTIRD